MKYPDFKSMLPTVKAQLLDRYRPEYCPNCGDEIEVTVVQSAVPCWIVSCKFCCAEYHLTMYEINTK